MIAALPVAAGAVYFFVQNWLEKTVAWREEIDFRWSELPLSKSGKTGFTQLPESKTGVAFINSLTEEQIKTNRVLLNGSGVAAGDVDGDGWVDVYFCGLDGPNVLYKNPGNWKFKDVTAEAGGACPDRSSTGTTFADIDGDLDFFVADILSRELQRRKTQMATTVPLPLAIGAIADRPQNMRNTLFPDGAKEITIQNDDERSQ